MPTDPSDPLAPPARILSTEQSEQRVRAQARWDAALWILAVSGALLLFAALAIRQVYGLDVALRALPIGFGFIILFASLFLALFTASVRNRPSWPNALWTVRILMAGVYALFLAAIGISILGLLSSAGMVFDADVVMVASFGLLLLGAISFASLPVAFVVGIIEWRARRMKADRSPPAREVAMNQDQAREAPPAHDRSALGGYLLLGILGVLWFMSGFTYVARMSGLAIAIACSLLILLLPLFDLAQQFTQSLLLEHVRQLGGLGIVALMFSVLLHVIAYRSIALEWFTVALLAVDCLLMIVALGGALLARLRASA